MPQITRLHTGLGSSPGHRGFLTVCQGPSPCYAACSSHGTSARTLASGGRAIGTRRQRLTLGLHIAPLLAVILWGGVYPGAKLGLREVPVLDFTYLRILLAMVTLFVVSGWTPTWRLPRELWPLVLRAGLAQTVFQGLLIAGLRWTTAGNSAILLATAPLLTAGWLAATRQTALGRRQWLGLVVGLGGVGLVVQGGSFGVTWVHLGGDLLALGAAAAWAWYSVVIGTC